VPPPDGDEEHVAGSDIDLGDCREPEVRERCIVGFARVSWHRRYKAVEFAILTGNTKAVARSLTCTRVQKGEDGAVEGRYGGASPVTAEVEAQAARVLASMQWCFGGTRLGSLYLESDLRRQLGG
jgi:hypothetical protein